MCPGVLERACERLHDGVGVGVGVGVRVCGGKQLNAYSIDF